MEILLSMPEVNSLQRIDQDSIEIVTIKKTVFDAEILTLSPPIKSLKPLRF